MTRKLRSKDTAADVGSLFNFDHVNPYLHKNKPFQVSSEHKPTSQRSIESQLPPRHLTHRTVDIHKYVRTKSSPRKVKLRDDPLADSVYTPFHNRMTRRETLMVNQDKSRVLSDLETLQSQKNQLLQHNWARDLPKITKITNPNDVTELTTKRNLTVIEINKRLQKYQDWKKRSEDLKNEMKFLEHSSVSHDPQAEYDLPVRVLKQKRNEERLKEYGPAIKLRLNNGYSLYIDQFAPPRVVRESPSPTPTLGSEEASPIPNSSTKDTEPSSSTNSGPSSSTRAIGSGSGSGPGSNISKNPFKRIRKAGLQKISKIPLKFQKQSTLDRLVNKHTSHPGQH